MGEMTKLEGSGRWVRNMGEPGKNRSVGSYFISIKSPGFYYSIVGWYDID